MHLITLAHHGEAQGVIELFNLKRISADVFGNEQLKLILTGEGPFEAAVKTSLAINKENIKSIINLGIAGSLSSDLKIGDLVEVRTLYLVQDQKLQFKTFQAAGAMVDCLTCFERILDQEKIKPLKGFGDIVDREAWGVAFAAKAAALPFRSFKIISDEAGTTGACEVTRDAAYDLSSKLAAKLAEIMNIQVEKEELLFPSGFHFTFSTKHQFMQLLKKITISEDKDEKEILESLPLSELRDMEIAQKDKTRKLIELMEDRTDPFKRILSDKLKGVSESFQKKGFKFHCDPQWENPKAVISFEVANDQELQSRAEELKKLSVRPFTDMMSGKIHVE
jgi:nucleoside phosphorylase